MCSQLPRILEEVAKKFMNEEPYSHVIFKFFTFLEEA